MVVVVTALAVCGTLLVAAVVFWWRAFRRPGRLPNAFRCRLALLDPSALGIRWKRTSYAVWVHDVLVHFTGPARTRVETYAVHFMDDAKRHETSPALARLAPGPTVFCLELDDGRQVLLAAARTSAALAAGPFLAALLVNPTLPH